MPDYMPQELLWGEEQRERIESRPASILTSSHREYLLGWDQFEGPNARQVETQKRMRIRTRVEAGLRYFALIERMSPQDRKQIFGGLDDDSDLQWSLEALLAFVYLGTQNTGIDFEELLVGALLKHTDRELGDEGEVAVAADVDIDIEYSTAYNAGRIREKLERGERLTRAEVGDLYLKDAIPEGGLTSADISREALRDELGNFPALSDFEDIRPEARGEEEPTGAEDVDAESDEEEPDEEDQ